MPEPLPPEAPAAAIAIFRTQVGLQKLDFWLRYPDYLADLMLDRYEKDGEVWLLTEATRILETEEPEIRRHSMLRHFFGAYEPLDDALAVLASPGLVLRRREGTIERTRQHNYYLTERGRVVAREMVSNFPDLRYYVDRVALLVRLTAGLGGTALKDLQYQQPEYALTAWRSEIAPITERVRDRLKILTPPPISESA